MEYQQLSTVDQAAKAAWPLSVSGVYVCGISVPDWLLLFTLIYTLLQIIILLEDNIPKWRKRYGYKNKR